jgi:Uri superfamily endonuclease
MIERFIQTIPREPGSYLLWLHLSKSQHLMVGKLGRFKFLSGDYVYTGSAHGPGGLQARLRRHLRGSGQLHWHIDHLRAIAQVPGYGYQVSTVYIENPLHSQPKECTWSLNLAALPEAKLPVPGFGSSDCRFGCKAHLVYFPEGINQWLERIVERIGVQIKTI